MMLSEDKISHLSHVILKGLLDRNLVEVLKEEGVVRRGIKQSIVAELKIGEDIDHIVRRKLQSLAKKLVEGSPEWEILYKKTFREEETKKGRASG